MLKINNSRKSKMTKKQYFMLLGTMVASLSFTAPVLSIKALAAENEEVLFEDQEDDSKTEDIKEDDVVRDNTVVPSEEQKQEEQKPEEKQEEQKQEEKQEEQKQNDGGSCVTPDNGYNPEEGQYWDPSIQTEAKKKGLTPDTPPETPKTPETPETPKTPETPETPSVPETPETPSVPENPSVPEEQQPAPSPAPAPAPKTGDITMNELYALLAGLAVGANSIGMVAGKIAKNSRKKR